MGVFGRAVRPDTALNDGDRLEIYRGLTFDPKESRRRRAEHRRALTARNGRERPQGCSSAWAPPGASGDIVAAETNPARASGVT